MNTADMVLSPIPENHKVIEGYNLQEFQEKLKKWEEFLSRVPHVTGILNVFDGHTMLPEQLLEVGFEAIDENSPGFKMINNDEYYYGILCLNRNNEAIIYISCTMEKRLDFSQAPVNYRHQTGTWYQMLELMYEHINWAFGDIVPIPEFAHDKC